MHVVLDKIYLLYRICIYIALYIYIDIFNRRRFLEFPNAGAAVNHEFLNSESNMDYTCHVITIIVI